MPAGRKGSLAVLIAARNSAATLPACLEALSKSEDRPDEVILVDDNSSDDTASIGERWGAKTIRLSTHRYASGARNAGVGETDCEVLVVLDADVLLAPDAIGRFREILTAPGAPAAVSGAYAPHPSGCGLGWVTLYKNLFQRSVMLDSPRRLTGFFSGCGAVRRDALESVGRFDEGRRWLEDIALGHKLAKCGFEVWFDPRITGTHLKHYTLLSWLRSDMITRAIPWGLLIWTYPGFTEEMVTSSRQRWSAVVAWLVITLVGLAFHPSCKVAGVASVSVLGLFAALQAPLLFRARSSYGAMFGLFTLAMQLLYYLNATVGFAIGLVVGFVKSRHSFQGRVST